MTTSDGQMASERRDSIWKACDLMITFKDAWFADDWAVVEKMAHKISDFLDHSTPHYFCSCDDCWDKRHNTELHIKEAIGE